MPRRLSRDFWKALTAADDGSINKQNPVASESEVSASVAAAAYNGPEWYVIELEEGFFDSGNQLATKDFGAAIPDGTGISGIRLRQGSVKPNYPGTFFVRVGLSGGDVDAYVTQLDISGGSAGDFVDLSGNLGVEIDGPAGSLGISEVSGATQLALEMDAGAGRTIDEITTGSLEVWLLLEDLVDADETVSS